MSVQPPPLAGYQRLCLVPGGNSGANGQVFRERCLATGEDVAVKYQQLSALQNEDKRKSLVRELRNHAALVAHPHRNIVGLRTAALLPGDWIAIVAELCEGDNLLKWLNGQSGIRATEVLALGVIAQVLSAAHHMHALGIFHRDIKLDNVCLARPAPPGTVPEIRVIDFGHSKMMSIDSIPNSIVATGFYMPPEIFRVKIAQANEEPPEQYDGQKVDVWLTGVTLQIMLCGRYPFAGMAAGVQLVMDDPSGAGLSTLLLSSVHQVNGLSPACLAFIQRCLEPNAANRPTTAALLTDPWIAAAIAALPVAAQSAAAAASAQVNEVILRLDPNAAV